MAAATDSDVLARAEAEGRVVVTLDADFHTLLALSDARQPSVVRIRIEGLKAEACADVIRRALDACSDELTAGAAVSVLPHQIRIRNLPLSSQS